MNRLRPEPTVTMRGSWDYRNEEDLRRFRELQWLAYLARAQFLPTIPRSQRSHWPEWVRKLLVKL